MQKNVPKYAVWNGAQVSSVKETLSIIHKNIGEIKVFVNPKGDTIIISNDNDVVSFVK